MIPEFSWEITHFLAGKQGKNGGKSKTLLMDKTRGGLMRGSHPKAQDSL
jgi:hypothetical protein